jgi:hypothetical protein
MENGKQIEIRQMENGKQIEIRQPPNGNENCNRHSKRDKVTRPCNGK